MNLVKNYLYNLSYQVFNLLLPIITMPYISRILGKEGLGIFTYTNSMVTYFIIFGSLGLGAYGSRKIAYVRDNKYELSKNFIEIMLLRILLNLVSLSIYSYVFILNYSYNRWLYILQAIYLISSMIDVSWFFVGLERIKGVTIRSFVVKILGLIGVFIFVKNNNDIGKYIMVLSVSTLLGQIIIWKDIKMFILKVNLEDLRFKNHIKNSIKFFIPQIAVQIYTLLDKTMLGYFSMGEVGMYENAEKLVKMSATILTSVTAVISPRLTNMFSRGDNLKINEYIKKIFSVTTFIAIPLSFGICGTAKEFSFWFFGNDFDGIYILIQILSFIIIAITWQNVIGAQYLLAIGKVNLYSKCLFLGAIINFLLNLIMILRFRAIGVTIATVTSEFSIALYMMYKVKGDFRLFESLKEIKKNLIAAISMFICLRIIGNTLGRNIITTGIQFIIGCLIYFILSVLLKSENILCFINIITKKNKIVVEKV